MFIDVLRMIAFSCEKTQAPGKRPDLCVHVVITKLYVGCWMSKNVKDISKRKQGEAHRNEVVMKCRDLEVSYLQIHLNRIFHYKL